MTSLFSKPKIPEIPVPPDRSKAQVQEAARLERLRLAAAQGRGSTILTDLSQERPGAGGLGAGQQSLGGKTILGA